MDKLKTLLTSLLSLSWSKQENAELSALGYPSTQTIEISIVWGETNYVAPSDGWITVGIRSAKADEFFNISQTTGFWEEVRSVSAQNYLSLAMPIKKGQTFWFDWNVEGISSATVKFRKNFANA